MKQSIIGYITALINSCNARLERASDNDSSSKYFNTFFSKELSDLLDFVEDIPEENKTFELVKASIDAAAENENLKKRIKELEESCGNMCEIEMNLHKKIEALNNKITILEGKDNG